MRVTSCSDAGVDENVSVYRYMAAGLGQLPPAIHQQVGPDEALVGLVHHHGAGPQGIGAAGGAGDIRSQQLYLASGNVVVELHFKDGSHFQVHTGMTGMGAFMDHAFAAWLEQTGRKQEDCQWYDPDNSCWFPPYEG